MEIIDCQVHPPFDIASWAPDLDDAMRNRVGVHITETATRAAGVDGALVNGPLGYSQYAYEKFPDRYRSIQNFDAPGSSWRDAIRDNPGFPKDIVIPFEDEDDFRAKAIDMQAHGLVAPRLACGFQPGRDTSQDLRVLQDGGYDPVFATTQQLGMPVCIWIAGSLDALPAIVEKFPELWVVVDHLGLVPRFFNESTLDDLPLLLALARYPNVAVKLSGIVGLSDEHHPHRDIWKIVQTLVQEFGADRLMWGSDYTMHPADSYAQAVTYLMESDVVTDADKELIFGANLRRIFNWPKG